MNKRLQQSCRIKKINIQKSLAFLRTSNSLSEKEIKKIIPFIIVAKFLMSGKTKECCTVHSTQSDLQTQFNPYQNPNGTLSRQRNNHPKIRKESKGL